MKNARVWTWQGLAPMWSRLLQALLALALLYAAASSVGYAFQAYPRHRVESAWIVFGVLCAVASLTRWSFASQSGRATHGVRVLAAMLLGALLLYAPSMGVGLLSDDYVLLAAADRWELTPPWQNFRPLSLGLWALLTTLGAGASLLHGLNIALHGLNGYLTYRLGRELGASTRTAVAAGTLWLVFPGAVEPVTWLSGIQDVLMTTLVLGFVIAALRDRPLVSLGCLLLATLTKETAVCGPLLLLVLRTQRHIAMPTIATAFGWCLLFGAGRLYFKPEAGLLDPVTGYVVKEFLAGAFGSLAMPWTRDQMFGAPWLVTAIIAATAGVAASAIARLRDRDLWTSAAVWAAWALIAALPVYRYFHISSDLQGTRYLYLPAVGWSLLVAIVALRQWRLAGPIAVGVLIVCGAFGTVVQQQRWRTAAQYRDSVLEQADATARSLGCRNAVFRDGPDSHVGVYVFRNGIGEAAARAGISDPDAPVDCSFSWQGDKFVEAGR